MRLFEAIVDFNHRNGDVADREALNLSDYRAALPMVALTCIDVRLNHMLPNILGISEEDFIWSRNAGNIITGPMSSTLRSLALACVVKGGREIAIIGHTDCKVCKTSVMDLTEGFKRLGIQRNNLPDNLVEYFGLFASERQNVLKAAEMVRNSPLIGSKIPVHGFLLDISTGKLEWLVNGYDVLLRSTVADGSIATMETPSGLKMSAISGSDFSGEPPVKPKKPLADTARIEIPKVEAKPPVANQVPPMIFDWKSAGGRHIVRPSPPHTPPVIKEPRTSRFKDV